MIKYMANVEATKKMKAHEGGDAFDVEVNGDKAVFMLDGKKFYESDKAFFEENFFQVQVGAKEPVKEQI